MTDISEVLRAHFSFGNVVVDDVFVGTWWRVPIAHSTRASYRKVWIEDGHIKAAAWLSDDETLDGHSIDGRPEPAGGYRYEPRPWYSVMAEALPALGISKPWSARGKLREWRIVTGLAGLSFRDLVPFSRRAARFFEQRVSPEAIALVTRAWREIGKGTAFRLIERWGKMDLLYDAKSPMLRLFAEHPDFFAILVQGALVAYDDARDLEANWENGVLVQGIAKVSPYVDILPRLRKIDCHDCLRRIEHATADMKDPVLRKETRLAGLMLLTHLGSQFIPSKSEQWAFFIRVCIPMWGHCRSLWTSGSPPPLAVDNNWIAMGRHVAKMIAFTNDDPAQAPRLPKVVVADGDGIEAIVRVIVGAREMAENLLKLAVVANRGKSRGASALDEPSRRDRDIERMMSFLFTRRNILGVANSWTSWRDEIRMRPLPTPDVDDLENLRNFDFTQAISAWNGILSSTSDLNFSSETVANIDDFVETVHVVMECVPRRRWDKFTRTWRESTLDFWFSAGNTRDAEGAVTGMWWTMPEHGKSRDWRIRAYRIEIVDGALRLSSSRGASTARMRHLAENDLLADDVATEVCMSAFAMVGITGEPSFDAEVLKPIFKRYGSWHILRHGDVFQSVYAGPVAKFRALLDPNAIAYASSLTANGHSPDWLWDAEIYAGLDDRIVPGAPFRQIVQGWEDVGCLLRHLWMKEPWGAGSDRTWVLARAVSEFFGGATPCWNLSREQLTSAFEFLNSFGGKKWRRGERYMENSSANVAVALLAQMPSSWWPKTYADWAGLAKVSIVLQDATEVLPSGEPFFQVVNSKGRWAEYAHRLADLLKVPDSEGRWETAAMQAHSECEEMVEAFVRQICVPIVVLAGFPVSGDNYSLGEDAFPETFMDFARGLLFRGKSYVGVIEASRRWFKGTSDIEIAISGAHDGADKIVDWEPCLPDWHDGDYDFIVLKSKHDLIEEGRNGVNVDGSRGMSHCVGTYSWQIRAGTSRIVSLRERGVTPVRRLSTIEFSRGTDGLRIVQHRGIANTEPSPKCEAAARDYLTMLESAGIDEIEWPSIQESEAETVIERAGYDFHRPGALEAAIGVWRRLIPRRPSIETDEGLRAEIVRAFGAAVETAKTQSEL